MRQLTCFSFEIGTVTLVKADDGRYDMVKTAVCTVEDTAMNKTAARAAIKEAGIDLKRGADVYWDKVGKVQYLFTTEDLKAIAKERVELPL